MMRTGVLSFSVLIYYFRGCYWVGFALKYSCNFNSSWKNNPDLCSLPGCLSKEEIECMVNDAEKFKHAAGWWTAHSHHRQERPQELRLQHEKHRRGQEVWRQDLRGWEVYTLLNKCNEVISWLRFQPGISHVLNQPKGFMQLHTVGSTCDLCLVVHN